jgi:Anti-sigma-K factor rskA
MNAPYSANLLRVLDLLAERSSGSLIDAERMELDQLLASLSREEQAVARAQEAQFEAAKCEVLAMFMNADRSVKISGSLRDRLLASGMSAMADAAPRSSPGSASGASSKRTPTTSPFRLRELLGWGVAAAAAVVAGVIYVNQPKPTPPIVTPPAPTIFEQRTALISQSDTKTIAWTATEDPDAKGVSGEVTWNQRLQKGFLRFKGLAVNDPAKFQYQLWIFDLGRVEPEHKSPLDQYPIDGGVFDIAAAQVDPATGDYIVPINAKLPVFNPAAFAVTIEKPGGVTVTKRERILVLGPVS